MPDDAYRAFAATQLQLSAVTFADTVRESLGELASDVANYLLVDSHRSLAAAITDGGLSKEWASDPQPPRAV